MPEPQLPKVSVVIPFYKGISWLYEALDSVFAQDYPDIEVLVINDGSPEDTTPLLERYHDRIVYIEKENGGPAPARNMGINRASGQYLALLDADDQWMPGKLKTQIRFMIENNAIWSHHDYELFGDGFIKGGINDTSHYQGNVLMDCYISFKVQTSCFVFRLDALNELPIRFSEDLRYGEDTAFYCELAQRWPLYHLNGVYARFRMRGDNAGFRAQVQLLHRAGVWRQIRDDQTLLRKLPRLCRWAYCLSDWLSLPIAGITDPKCAEMLSRVLYIIPYCMFKICARTMQNRNREI